MPSSPRRPIQTRKAPTEAHSPTKGVELKKINHKKYIDNDALYISSAESTDDNHETMRVEESKDNTNTALTHMSISQFDIIYESEEYSSYESIDKE